ncbi:MAG: hypothetical protein MUO26_12675 [Methanotrichaceae archaeon]|nr:hypothetical protein [Methanotrichaceae archaeon]
MDENLELLRKYEPVIRFTNGELFFPCAVDEYVRRCSLWIRNIVDHSERQLLREGELDLDELAKYKEVPEDHVYFLRFVDKPPDALEFQAWLNRSDKPSFKAAGRLARVGLTARLLDLLFDLSFLMRGAVPGGTAAAAQIKYRQIRSADPRYVYYGRVIREGGYVILNYIFFFAMNDWRSTFKGVNDHESDWEQIFVYLTEDKDGQIMPIWGAFASHDFSGDDLRRRWDDQELHKFDDTHSLVYSGAGSHSSYFLQGDYVMSLEPEITKPVRKVINAIRHFWMETLGQGEIRTLVREAEILLTVPFVDYARGDGISIGPGQQYNWTPILISNEVGWIENYHGLWGLDTMDAAGGERAPAGPKYNRDGTVRNSWYDPLGWAGLDKVAPPNQIEDTVKRRISELETEIIELDGEIEQNREQLRQIGIEVIALQRSQHLEQLYETSGIILSEKQDKLHELFARRIKLDETLKATRSLLKEIEMGNLGDPQAHIKHKRMPSPPISRETKAAELWSALSVGILLFLFAGVLLFVPEHKLAIGVLFLFIFIAIEATVYGWLSDLLVTITILLAIFCSFILIGRYLELMLLILLFAIGIWFISVNLKELSSG